MFRRRYLTADRRCILTRHPATFDRRLPVARPAETATAPVEWLSLSGFRRWLANFRRHCLATLWRGDWCNFKLTNPILVSRTHVGRTTPAFTARFAMAGVRGLRRRLTKSRTIRTARHRF